MNESKGIDVAKIFCAFLVVAIHTEPFHSLIWLDRGLGLITRIPVPFFFVCSGYFFFKNKNIGIQGILKYEKHILIMYVIWTVIYFPFAMAQWGNPTTAFVFKKFFIDGFLHLWFLKALAIAVLLVWLLSKKFSDVCVLAISSLFLITVTLCSTYRQLLDNVGG